MTETVFDKIETFNKAFLSTKIMRKYKILAQNPFSFFRGTNHLFYDDLSSANFPESPVCWICGDLHLENFGSYKGDNRLVYFDLNDFDESILAPVSWELARVLTSIHIAFDSLKITDDEAAKASRLFLKKYKEVLSAGKPKYIETRTAKGIVKKFLSSVEHRPNRELFQSRTVMKKGKLKLNADHAKHLLVDKVTKDDLMACCKSWIMHSKDSPNNYKLLDVNFRLAGTGSLGVRRYVFLIEKIKHPGRYMLIDMKEATASSLAPYVKNNQPIWESEAERMVNVQRVMQNVAPAWLGSMKFDGASYLMQELQPTKDRINFKIIQDKFEDVCCVIEDMAMLTASAHLRTVGRRGSCSADELINFAAGKQFTEELIDYATRYKLKVLSDHDEFKKHYEEIRKRRKTSPLYPSPNEKA